MSDERLLRFEVAPRDARTRIDVFLAARKVASRSQLKLWIEGGRIRVNGRVVRPRHLLTSGEQIEVDPPQLVSHRPEPEDIPLRILFEDSSMIVIDKPAGLVVHPAPGNWTGTVANAVMARLDGCDEFDPQRPGIVHRLDKDTSGVLVIARTASVLTTLAAQFQNREVKKQYLAIVWGRVVASQGVIRAPIGRHPVERKRMAVRAGGREAITRYEVISRMATATYLRAFPETGRTHQIRVHLAQAGHPIVGDTPYGGGGRKAPPPIRRHALHAEQLELTHPVTGERMKFLAPVPDDFTSALRALGAAEVHPEAKLPPSR